MSLFKNFDVAGSAMSAQSLRLNLTASNMANANTNNQPLPAEHAVAADGGEQYASV